MIRIYLSFILLSLYFIFPTLCFSYIDDLDAKSAVVVDGQTGKILYGKNPHLKHPPASTTKLVTAMIALEHLEPEKVVVISKKAAKTVSVEPKLKEGQTYTVRDLVYLALMRSVNSATVALAEAVAGDEKRFVKLMNQKVRSIGAKETKFTNSSGLPGRGQYTTVYDLTKIISHALTYPIIKDAINTRIYLIKSSDGEQYFIQNTNQLLWSDDNMIGGKTGYTKSARHCFVVASKIDGKVVYAAVLGASNRDKLWKDTEFLFAKAKDVFLGKQEPVVKLSDEKIVKAKYKSKKSCKAIKVKSKKIKKNKKIKKTKDATSSARSI
ncbi:MAG: D-alanyl-D-alanine carboxypeptidase [Thermodesulfovibrio sp.]|nr:D-alanyl-D-alanine carboxypeptidase [Thermodesulfovibrio sp.]